MRSNINVYVNKIQEGDYIVIHCTNDYFKKPNNEDTILYYERKLIKQHFKKKYNTYNLWCCKKSIYW